MTIDQLWNSTLDYHARVNLMRLAGYRIYDIHRSKSFFLTWGEVDYRIQQCLWRAECLGKYNFIQRKSAAERT